MPEDLCHLVPAEYHRQGRRPSRADQGREISEVDAEDVTIEKQQRRERLVLCRRGDACADGQVVEKGCDLGFTERRRVSRVVKEDEAANPGNIGGLCSRAVMAAAERETHLVEKLGLTR